jgi:hypothetical protein
MAAMDLFMSLGAVNLPSQCFLFAVTKDPIALRLLVSIADPEEAEQQPEYEASYPEGPVPLTDQTYSSDEK